jgi:hypothetical protein
MTNPSIQSTKDIPVVPYAPATEQDRSRHSDTMHCDTTTRDMPRAPTSAKTIRFTAELPKILIKTVVDENIITGSTCNDTPVPGDRPNAALPASEELTMNTTETTSTNTTSPFLILPGELRKRIYRLYFEDFEEQMSRRFTYRKSKMSPNFLALMHTDREVRSEAGPIFYKEFASFHSFSCPIDQPIEAVVLSQIRDVCSLISIRDEQMRISIRCTPSRKDHRSSVHDKDDAWGSREIVAFTRSLWVHLARSTHRQNSSSSCAAESTVEVHAGEDFLVRYRLQNAREDKNFLHVEGPLAEVDWSKEKGSWSFG